LRHVPAWVFHGTDDPVVPVSGSRDMVEALKRVGAPVRYTEYAGVGHNSWDPAYAEADLWTWMLAQRRRPRAEGR
jgi:predicted peptidase